VNNKGAAKAPWPVAEVKPGSGAPPGRREAVSQDLEVRIERMFSRDRLIAWIFVTVLWIVLLFVLLAVQPHIHNDAVTVVLWIALAVLGLFNTASIAAMVRHYAHDKQHIYSIDIRHLDAGR
jgi:hypothetical protein